VYTGFLAVLVNLVVVIVATLILRAARTPDGRDATSDGDYLVDEGDERLTLGTEQYPEPATA
jgi:SSS family solute:Na+ symporter